jgi:hypothetical protein
VVLVEMFALMNKIALMENAHVKTLFHSAEINALIIKVTTTIVVLVEIFALLIDHAKKANVSVTVH